MGKLNVRFLAGVVLGLALHSSAQSAVVSGFTGEATPIQAIGDVPAQSDTIVTVAAESQGLSPIAPEDLPTGGTYWWVEPNGQAIPTPFPPPNLNQPIYQITDSQFLIDQTCGQVLLKRSRLGSQVATDSIALAATAQAGAVVNLINQVLDAEDAQQTRMMLRSFGMDDPEDSGGSDSPMFTPVYDTNGLWLEITNVSNGWSYLNLHNATNQVYAIESTTVLGDGWNVETELWPVGDQTNILPFAIQNLGRQDLFFRAQDWTGVTENGNTTPDWWFWEYFGTTALSDTNLDLDGNTLGYDYTNNLVPHTFNFSGIQVTNNYVSSSSTPVQLNVTGFPYYVAVLVDDANFDDAVWNTYTTSNLTVNLGLTEGWHDVWIGLRGHADVATNAVWQWKQLKLDYAPPQLVITSPASGIVSVPMVQVQGFASEQLTRISYDISNAVGLFTNYTGYVTAQIYDTNLLAFTTNFFQCYDVLLTNGVNQISVHVFDLAGNETTTNVSLTVDYSGDTTAPALTVLWPTDGTPISGASFTLQAQVDDYTATVTAAIVDTNGVTNTVQGLVERSGLVSADLPLNFGTNTLTITATDAAGNVTVTNLTVTRNDADLMMNPLTDDQLNQSTVNVSGTVSDVSYSVTVNGVAAAVSGDPVWEADNVPVSPLGTANLNVVVRDSSGNLVTTHNYIQPQSAKIGVMDYSSYYYSYGVGGNLGILYDEEHPDGTPTTDESDAWTEWTYQLGGFDYAHFNTSGSWTPNLNPPADEVLWDYPLAAGEDAYNPSPWENADETFYYIHPHNGKVIDSVQTRVMIEPVKPAAAGASRAYLVRVNASEFSNPLYAWPGTPGDVPLPPEWLQLNGQSLTRTTITNGDGTVEGLALITAPAGMNVPLTVKATQVHQYQDYSFNVSLAKTKEDWQADVRTEINQDSGYSAVMTEYLASNGFSIQNRIDIQGVYAFYQKVFLEQPTEYYWCGLAKLAGAPVYAALSDAQHAAPLLYNFQDTLVQMNVDILNDLAWQFEAYRKGGLNALEEINAVTHDTTILDIAPWREIDQGIQLTAQGDPSGPILIQQGNQDLLQREQQQVLADGYHGLSTMDAGVIANYMSLLAKCPIWDPSTNEPYAGRNFEAIVPGGNLTTYDDRWTWITYPTTGIWDTWKFLTISERSSQVSVDLRTRASTYANLSLY